MPAPLFGDTETMTEEFQLLAQQQTVGRMVINHQNVQRCARAGDRLCGFAAVALHGSVCNGNDRQTWVPIPG
jgi:hypothetical protein